MEKHIYDPLPYQDAIRFRENIIKAMQKLERNKDIQTGWKVKPVSSNRHKKGVSIIRETVFFIAKWDVSEGFQFRTFTNPHLSSGAILNVLRKEIEMGKKYAGLYL